MMRAIEFNISMDDDFHPSPLQPCPELGLTAVQQIEKMPINCSLYHIKAAEVLCVEHRDEPRFLRRLARLAGPG
jgi:hypothetical protein